MHGGAVTLASQFLKLDFKPDLLLATDMLDLTTFLSLTRQRTAKIPTAVYFHENQLSYPWSPEDRDVAQNRDKHYGFINYTTGLAADAIFFNSRYHRDSFLSELERLLKHFPDYRELENIDRLRSKSQVLSLGLDLTRFDQHNPAKRKPENQERFPHSDLHVPVILWNHRWEYDKNPGDFFQALFILAEKGVAFQVAVLGECFSRQPKEFTLAKEALGERVVKFGYAEDFAEYASWLWRADILPVTSHQDFFGASVVEAIYCGCVPLLPKRLAYPELLPADFHQPYFYNDFDDLVSRLERILKNKRNFQKDILRSIIRSYDWNSQAPMYDKVFEKLVHLR